MEFCPWSNWEFDHRPIREFDPWSIWRLSTWIHWGEGLVTKILLQGPLVSGEIAISESGLIILVLSFDYSVRDLIEIIVFHHLYDVLNDMYSVLAFTSLPFAGIDLLPDWLSYGNLSCWHLHRTRTPVFVHFQLFIHFQPYILCTLVFCWTFWFFVVHFGLLFVHFGLCAFGFFVEHFCFCLSTFGHFSPLPFHLLFVVFPVCLWVFFFF